MKAFFLEIYTFFRDILVTGFSFFLAFIFLLAFAGALIATVLFWPFYSYSNLDSFVESVHKQYPIELKTALQETPVSTQDKYILMGGKVFCAAKLVHQQQRLIDLLDTPEIKSSDKRLYLSFFKNADTKLCPSSLTVVASK